MSSPTDGTSGAPADPDAARLRAAPEGDPADPIARARPPAWLAGALVPAAPDFDERVVRRESDPAGDPAGGWRAARREGLEVRTFECLAPNGRLRFSGQLRTADGTDAVGLGELRGAELLVQRGALELGGRHLGPGTYVRLPRGAAEPDPEADPAEAADAGPPLLAGGSLVYLSIGQIEPTDRERRVIDTGSPDAWLDGPIDGIEVLPLHGHRTGNVMLVRWSGPAAFRPKLDPTGEELLVLEGTLHDARGSYPAGTWIRNPVPAWQSWGGSPGALVCYKSGHFGALADRSAPTP